MRHTTRLSIFAILTASLSACNQQIPQNTSISNEQTPIMADVVNLPPAKTDRGRELRQKTIEILPNLTPERRVNFQFQDFEAGIAYDTKLGEVKLDVGYLDPATNIVKFSDGSSFLAPPKVEDNLNLSGQALLPCQPYRQVKSNYNIAAIKGNLKTPSSSQVTGIDEQREGSFNYLSIYSGNVSSEAGWLTTVPLTGSTAYTKGNWYIYETGSSINASVDEKEQRTGWVVHRDFALDSSSGALLAGRKYSFIYSVTSGISYFTVTEVSTGYSRTWARAFQGYSFNTASFGRTTSLLVNNTNTAYSKENIWSDMAVQPNAATSSNPYYSWTSGYTSSLIGLGDDGAGPCTRYKSIPPNTTRDYYDSISIFAQ